MLDPSGKVLAVLDWELSTLGDPFSDLAYNCLAYHLPQVGGCAEREAWSAGWPLMDLAGRRRGRHADRTVALVCTS